MRSIRQRRIFAVDYYGRFYDRRCRGPRFINDGDYLIDVLTDHSMRRDYPRMYRRLRRAVRSVLVGFFPASVSVVSATVTTATTTKGD